MAGGCAPHTQAQDDPPIFIWASVASMVSGVTAGGKERAQGRGIPLLKVVLYVLPTASSYRRWRESSQMISCLMGSEVQPCVQVGLWHHGRWHKWTCVPRDGLKRGLLGCAVGILMSSGGY